MELSKSELEYVRHISLSYGLVTAYTFITPKIVRKILMEISIKDFSQITTYYNIYTDYSTGKKEYSEVFVDPMFLDDDIFKELGKDARKYIFTSIKHILEGALSKGLPVIMLEDKGDLIFDVLKFEDEHIISERIVIYKKEGD